MIEELRERTSVTRVEDLCRYAGALQFDKGTGSVGANVFDRHPKDDDSLSVNRRGIFSNSEADDDAAIRRVSATRGAPGKTARFIVINTGSMLDILEEFEREVFVCEDPLEAEGDKAANPAHALIVGLPFVGEEIGSMTSELIGDRLRRITSNGFPAHPDHESLQRQ